MKKHASFFYIYSNKIVCGFIFIDFSCVYKFDKKIFGLNWVCWNTMWTDDFFSLIVNTSRLKSIFLVIH